MEKSELKIKKNSCCVTAFYSLFEKLLVVIHVNTSYLDIHVLAWIELKIDNFFIINIPGPSQKTKQKQMLYIYRSEYIFRCCYSTYTVHRIQHIKCSPNKKKMKLNVIKILRIIYCICLELTDC